MKTFRKLTIPYLIWMFVMLILPVLFIILYAFIESGNDIVTFKFTLENFKKILTDKDFVKILLLSIRIGLITTVLCVLIGYPIAYLISKSNKKRRGLYILLITFPMWINMLVRTYAWIGILSDNGLINKVLSFIGLSNVNLLYTDFAVILGMVYNFLPFMIIEIETSLEKLDHSLLEAANDLGANEFQRFWRITFPFSLPGVISGITLVFLPAVTSFVVPKLLGGGSYFLVGNLIENQFISTGEWSFGSAIAMIMALIIMIMMHLTNRLENRLKFNERKMVKSNEKK